MTISLLFGVHAHQPVGNFTRVIDEAHVRCYGKFLRVLERYPEFRFTVHFSGWLLGMLQQRFPDDMALLAKMTARGQVEWFGSGDGEPVLAMIPERDRVSQLTTLSDRIERYVGQRPKGAWLTERVWESAVVSSLAKSGIRFVAVDDYHFLCAGTDAAKLDSFYTTEEGGVTLDLFPISEALRYRLPFSPADEAVRYLEEQAIKGHRAAIYFDDVEKFGIWPETYDWVYERGWLERFVEGVLRSPHITTTSFADYHAANPTRGVVYLPTTSYIEMNEWTLPAPVAREYAALVHAQKEAGVFEAHKAFLRGGIWRNFLSRYPESNWMQKRMLSQSARLAVLPAAQHTPEMLQLLHYTQANDAYWHGLFGGLYLPHLRRAVWNNLIALEAELDKLAGPQPATRADLDLDGHDEIFLRNAELLAVARDDGDACLIELSSFGLKHNFGDTLKRYAEGYHAKITQGASTHAADGSGIASAHDRVTFKHPIAVEDIVPDTRPRGIGVDQVLAADGGVRAVSSYKLAGITTNGMHFAAAHGDATIDKHISLDGAAAILTYRTHQLAGEWQVLINLAMPSCDGYAGRYILADGSVPCGFGQALALEDLTSIHLEDGVLGGALMLAAQPPARFAARPHMTVSQSEAGFEKIMQAVEITLTWPAAAGADSEYQVILAVAGLMSSSASSSAASSAAS